MAYTARGTLALAYVVVLVTFLLLVASAADMANQKSDARKKARNEMSEATLSLLQSCGCKKNVSSYVNQLFYYWKPPVHARHWRKQENDALYAATWVFLVISFTFMVLVSYLLSLGFVDLYLSFPFRQWSLATRADRLRIEVASSSS
jgi:Flp pilus assembly protein TadB